MIAPPHAVAGQVVESGPSRVRSENRWLLRLADGHSAILGQLLPELADEESLRRRYVYEAERLAALTAPRVARTLAVGPAPDPRDPSADPPWRLREQVAGQRLDEWLSARAPAPVDEAVALAAALADTVHGVHRAGAVLRDLEPRAVFVADGSEVWISDAGLARLDILSTHSASSLLLEGSPYAAPEHLSATSVDARVDVFTIGVILWQALTGTTPFGDGPALLRRQHALPRLEELVPGAPAGLHERVARCLDHSAEQRPASCRELAEALRGNGGVTATALARITCQACGQPMRPGLRLCLSCGREAVQFHHAPPEQRRTYSLMLRKAGEDEIFDRALRSELTVIADRTPDRLDFIVGDARMYSKSERAERISLPARLFAGLDKETAEGLARRFKDASLTVALRDDDRPRRVRRAGKITTLAGTASMAASVAGGILVDPVLWFTIFLPLLITLVGLLILRGARDYKDTPLAQLRAAPAALPASDPLVARLAGLLGQVGDRQVHEQIGELALVVQRLVDHRGALHAGDGAGAQAAEVDVIIEPVEPIVGLIEGQVRALIAIDAEMADFDEGTMVRAIAASEARGEPELRRKELLRGLDRLRELEDRRAQHLHSLLEAGSLLRHVVEMGLRVEDPRRLEENYTRMALAALED